MLTDWTVCNIAQIVLEKGRVPTDWSVGIGKGITEAVTAVDWQKNFVSIVWIFAIAILAMLGLSPVPVFGQSLPEALSQAYLTNYGIQSQREGLKGTHESIIQAQSAKKPTVGFNASTGYSVTWSDRSIDSLISGTTERRTSSSPLTAGISLQQNLYEGGRIRGQINQAQASTAASEAELASAEQSLLLQATSVYMDVVRDLENVDIRLANLNVLNKQLEAVQARFEVGDVSRTDVAQVSAQLAQVKSQLALSKAQLVNSEAAYYAVIGSRPANLNQAPLLPRLPDTIEHAIQITMSINPQNVAAQKNEEAARQSVKIAQSAFRPTIGLNANAQTSRSTQFSGQESESISVTGNFSMPIFTGGLNDSRLREAKYTESQARFARLETEKQTVQQTIAAWHNYLASRTQFASSQEQVRAARIAFEGAQEEEHVGLRTVLDVLIAEQALRDALLAQNEARRNVIVSTAQLLAAMGSYNLQSFGMSISNGVDPAPDPDLLFSPLDNIVDFLISKAGNELLLRRDKSQVPGYSQTGNLRNPPASPGFSPTLNPNPKEAGAQGQRNFHVEFRSPVQIVPAEADQK